MKGKVHISVFIVTALLLLYTILISLDAPLRFTGFLFFLSPFLMTWMVISVLRSKEGNVRELDAEEEWGYADKNKEDLNTF